MAEAAALLAWAIAIGISIPMFVLAAECLAGSPFGRRSPYTREAPPFTVLMPAHDEAAGIAVAIRSVLPQLRTRDRLIVIADNCTDDTAAIAEREGATILVRIESELRGKGYALEYARQLAVHEGGQVVIILDADCRAAPRSLCHLAATAARHHAVVQGCYLLEPPANASVRVRISCFAFLVKNLVRQMGLRRLGGSAILQGSGMAFPASIFRRVRWSTESLVEDLELGLRLIAGGDIIMFEPAACFTSDASSDRGTRSQRKRWEHGMLATAARYIPHLTLASLHRGPRLLLSALDLLVPPTVMLIVLAAAATLLVVILAGAGWQIVVLLFAWVAMFAGLGAAWAMHGRSLLPARSLGEVARYMIWKLPILIQFASNRERRWLRTEREP